MKMILSCCVAVMMGVMNAYAGGTIKGKVAFTGVAPKMTPINMAADPTCKKLHTTPVLNEQVVVNKNGTLKWTFVHVKGGLEGKKFPAPTTPVVFDQNGCHYTPRVFGILVGQPLEIRNSDPTLHNVHAMPKSNPQFNVGMPVKDMKITKKFDKPEIGAMVKCDVHPWMRAWANVVENPYYNVTMDEGTYEIKGVPAGKYKLAAWHEKFGMKEIDVTVEEGKTATADFSYTGTESASAAK